MTDNEKKALYESIIKDVAKTVKKHLNEDVIKDTKLAPRKLIQ